MTHETCECCSTQDPDRFTKQIREQRTREEERATYFKSCNQALRDIENVQARAKGLETLKELEGQWKVDVPSDALPNGKRVEERTVLPGPQRSRSQPRVDTHNSNFEEVLKARPRRYEPIHPALPIVDPEKPLRPRSPGRGLSNKYKDIPPRLYDFRTPRKPASVSGQNVDSPRRRSLSASSHVSDCVPRVALLADKAAEQGALRRRELEARRNEQQAMLRQRSRSVGSVRSTSSAYADVPSTLQRYISSKEPIVPPKNNPRSLIESRKEEERRKITHRSSTPKWDPFTRSLPLATACSSRAAHSPNPSRKFRHDRGRSPALSDGGEVIRESSPPRRRTASCPEQQSSPRGQEMRPSAVTLASHLSPRKRLTSSPVPSGSFTPSLDGSPVATLHHTGGRPTSAYFSRQPASPSTVTSGKTRSSAQAAAGSPSTPSHHFGDPKLRGQSPSPTPKGPRMQSPSGRCRSGSAHSIVSIDSASSAGGSMVTLDFHLGKNRHRGRDEREDGRRLSQENSGCNSPIRDQWRNRLGPQHDASARWSKESCTDEDVPGDLPDYMPKIPALCPTEFNNLALRMTEGSPKNSHRNSASIQETMQTLEAFTQEIPRQGSEKFPRGFSSLDDPWNIDSPFTEPFP